MNGESHIKAFVFDITEESKPTQAFSEARVKKNKFYLGQIDIPFSFLMAIPSVSGMYKLDRPMIIFGYGVRKSGLFDDQENEEVPRAENLNIHTYINLDLFT